jgi:serine protease
MLKPAFRFPCFCAARAATALALTIGVAAAGATDAVPEVGANAGVSAPAPALGLIVKMKDGVSGEQRNSVGERLQKALTDSRVKPLRMHPVGGSSQHLDFGRLLSGDEAERMAAKVRARPEIAWVVPNVREQRLQLVAPNDTYFGASGTYPQGQWWLRAVSGSSMNAVADRHRGVPGVQTAWSRSLGSPNSVVAVLDTGITDHPDLNIHVLPGYDFVSEVEHANDGDGRDADPSDPGDGLTEAEVQTTLFRGCGVSRSSWHGTVIAGMLAAVTNNATGSAGISWNGRVLPVRVAGKCGASVADIVAGMRWAAGIHQTGVPDNPNPARIVNISFGGSAPCNEAYQEAIDELAARNVVVVAAAGNEHGAVSRPASCARVVGVAALNRDGFKSTYSNFGAQIVVSTVGGDLMNGGAWGAFGANGSLSLADEGLLTLSNDGHQEPGNPTFTHVSGTSFATPLTAGVLGLMLSVNPNLTVQQMIAGVGASARPHVKSTQIGVCSNDNPGRCLCTNATCGAGILDADEALRYAAAPGAYVALGGLGAVIDSTELATAAAAGPDLPPNASAAPSGGGGGALRLSWLVALAVAAWAARRRNA